MAEQLKKLFGKDLQKNLFPDNAFYKNSKVDSGVEPDVAIVQVPQAGAAPGLVTNPSSFPLTVGVRTDDVKEYAVDLIATLPIHIEDVNELVISYSKRKDVLEDNALALNSRVADIMAYAWSTGTAAKVLKTSGTTRPASVSGGAAKKKVTYSDFLALGEAMDNEDIPEEGRYALATAAMYNDLKNINEFISFDYVNNKPTVSGAIGIINGFTIFKRSKTALYDDVFALKGIDDASAVTDRDSILAWHSSFVRRAEGNIKAYADMDNPLYLGSIFNAKVRAGGMIGRTDEKGVFMLVQESLV